MVYIHIDDTYTTGPYGTAIGSTYTPTLPLHPPTPLTAAGGPITVDNHLTVAFCYTTINVPTFADLATPRLTPKSMLNVPLSKYLVPLGPSAAVLPSERNDTLITVWSGLRVVGHTLFLQNSVAFFWGRCVDFTLGEGGSCVYKGCIGILHLVGKRDGHHRETRQ